MNDYALMIYYEKYLKNIRKVSESTVKHYRDALKYISNFLIEKKIIDGSIYEVHDIGELESIKNFLCSDPDFTALDGRGHQMYSAGFNNYLRFAHGKGFTNLHNALNIMDIKIPKENKEVYKNKTWNRSNVIKIQSMESAGYMCECNPKHVTFTAKSTGHQYMEGHHAIPMKLQDKFPFSLDIYANIVCLCPICHRLLHYGLAKDKKHLLDKIYYDRSDRLAASGIEISKNDFEVLLS